MIRNVDYGQIEQANVSAQGRAVFQICSADGTPLTVTWSESAPQSGCWVDTSEQDLQLRSWSESQGLWVEVKPFVKCSIPGIATGLLAGDGVELSCLLLQKQRLVAQFQFLGLVLHTSHVHLCCHLCQQVCILS